MTDDESSASDEEIERSDPTEGSRTSTDEDDDLMEGGFLVTSSLIGAEPGKNFSFSFRLEADVLLRRGDLAGVGGFGLSDF
jgi:hypothetical protein